MLSKNAESFSSKHKGGMETYMSYKEFMENREKLSKLRVSWGGAVWFERRRRSRRHKGCSKQNV